MEWSVSGPHGVSTSGNPPDVNTSGGIGDMVDAIKRGGGRIRDDAAAIVDRMRERYAAARTARMLRLAAVVAVGYLLLRRR
jgi:orotate phosphoribosyltransferase